MKKLMLCVLAIVVFEPLLYADGVFVSHRSYRVGNHFSYRLATDTYHNGKLATKSIALSRHTVVDRGGVPYERVSFVGMKVSTNPASGRFESLDAFARRVKPFYIPCTTSATASLRRRSQAGRGQTPTRLRSGGTTSRSRRPSIERTA